MESEEQKETTNSANPDTLTKQQKKNKKKRDAAKKKKQGGCDEKATEVSKETNGVNHTTQTVVENGAKDDGIDVDNFEEELCWCVQQIQLGLQTQKPSKDQVSKSNKLMEQLRSKKTPKPKKRMLMRTNFGNYREKMEKEKKQVQQVNPAKFVDVKENLIQKSVFYRKKVDDMPILMKEEEPKGEQFRFNFS